MEKKEMIDKLIELFQSIAIDKIYYPISAISAHQNDLMRVLAEVHDADKLTEILEGKSINIWNDEDMGEIFSDWMAFNDWVTEEKITGWFAEINTPVLKNISFDKDGKFHSSSCSFGYCHIDFIYYESLEELLNKGNEIVEFWRNYDIKIATAKKANYEKI